ncbi:MAG: type II toxin-antitoxin system RelE family toxin [Jiangellaceae bacterium]
MVEIYVVRAVAEDDLRHIGRPDIRLIFKKIALLETDVHAGQPLGGELTGFRKLVVGRTTYRIVYRIGAGGSSIEICEIWAVGHRRNSEVYVEASRRVRRAADSRPELLNLAELMATVELLEQDVRLRAPQAQPDPVPGWLFTQLVRTAGVAPHEVAAMTGEEAFAAWNAWMSRPR